MNEPSWHTIILTVLRDLAAIPYASGDLHMNLLADAERGQYALLTVGWEGGRRVHYCPVHLALRDGLVWVEADRTDISIATELVAAGIPQGCIVLGFQPPELRPYTDFAVP